MTSPAEAWHEELCDALYDAEEGGQLAEIDEDYGIPVKEGSFSSDALGALPAGMLELYRSFDGMHLGWTATRHEPALGKLHFLELGQVLRDREGELYDADDVSQEPRIACFKPFDLVTEETQCGFLLEPETRSRSIFYNRSGLPQLYDLDVDFAGYLAMALASRIYVHWPKVLLDIQSGQEGAETRDFRRDMPLIFPAFRWEEYVARYQALRLSATA